MKHLKKLIAVIFMTILCSPLLSYAIEKLTVPTTTGDTATEVTLELSTDQNSYTTGEIIQFTITMAGDATIDVYMTATFPDGSFASYTAAMVPEGANSIIPLIKGLPLADIAGTYTLPLPVIPLFPEGTSEIWVVFVKAGKNPLMSANWLAEDMVSFAVDQNDSINPLVDIENKTFTAPLGEIGTITITFGETTIEDEKISGSAEGKITVTLPNGGTKEIIVTGTYSYADETLTLHLEGDDGFFIDCNLKITEDGMLTGSYETSDGKTGEIEINLHDILSSMPECTVGVYCEPVE